MLSLYYQSTILLLLGMGLQLDGELYKTQVYQITAISKS